MNTDHDETCFETISCPACDCADSTLLVEAEDDYGGRPGRFQFVSCTRCQFSYQNPRLRFEHIGQWYDEEYIAHRKKTDWGWLTPFYERAMGKHDREKLKLVQRYCSLDTHSDILDVGCGSGSFLDHTHRQTGAKVSGVDFKDLSNSPLMGNVDFEHGRLIEQEYAAKRFDLITMWHFLEHDYDANETLIRARDLLADDGRLIIEVPRLDSLTYKLFKHRWPGLQAPQHTALYTWDSLEQTLDKAGLTRVDHLSWGAFPPYFYLFTGTAFTLLRGKGLNLQKAILPYFLGQLLALPLTLLHRHLNLAMQTIVCERQ